MYVRACLQQDEIIVHPFASIESIENELLEKTYVVVKEGNEFYGLITMYDVIKMGHNLVIDCIRKRPLVYENESTDNVLNIMNQNNEYVLPVFSNNKEYIGSTTYKRILQEVGLLKRAPVTVCISNMIGDYNTESIKQTLFHELFHNTKNPIQVIYSSINLLKETKCSIETMNLLESIQDSTKQIDDTITNLLLTHLNDKLN
jgi:predicted transcriptional regulator